MSCFSLYIGPLNVENSNKGTWVFLVRFLYGPKVKDGLDLEFFCEWIKILYMVPMEAMG